MTVRSGSRTTSRSSFHERFRRPSGARPPEKVRAGRPLRWCVPVRREVRGVAARVRRFFHRSFSRRARRSQRSHVVEASEKQRFSNSQRATCRVQDPTDDTPERRRRARIAGGKAELDSVASAPRRNHGGPGRSTPVTETGPATGPVPPGLMAGRTRVQSPIPATHLPDVAHLGGGTRRRTTATSDRRHHPRTRSVVCEHYTRIHPEMENKTSV